MSNFERYTVLLAVVVASLVGMLAAVAVADDGPPITQDNSMTGSGWACGNVQFYQEQLSYPASTTYITRYHVVNPDAIPYDRSLGVPRYIVEFRLAKDNATLTLNGWPCRLISTIPTPKPRPKLSQRAVDPDVETCTLNSKGECW